MDTHVTPGNIVLDWDLDPQQKMEILGVRTPIQNLHYELQLNQHRVSSDIILSCAN